MIHLFLSPEDESLLFRALQEVVPTVVLNEDQSIALNAHGTSRIQWLRCRPREQLGHPTLQVGVIAVAEDVDPETKALFATIRKLVRKLCSNAVETFNPNSEHFESKPQTGIWLGPRARERSLGGLVLASNSANLFYRAVLRAGPIRTEQ